MKLISSLSLSVIAAGGLTVGSLNAQTTTHFLGGSPDNGSNPDILAYDKNQGNFNNQFTLGTGVTTATSSLFTGTVNDVDFSYNVRLTALGDTTYLNTRSNAFLRPATSEFDDNQGVLVEIINLTNTGGTNSGNFNVVFDAYAGFSTSGTVIGSFMTFTPTNVGASNKDASLSFDRVSGDGLDTITLSTDDSTTFAQWTAGATSMEIYGGTGSNSAELRNLFLNFTTVAVPEPGSYALIAGMLGLTSVMLRRRRQTLSMPKG